MDTNHNHFQFYWNKLLIILQKLAACKTVQALTKLPIEDTVRLYNEASRILHPCKPTKTSGNFFLYYAMFG